MIGGREREGRCVATAPVYPLIPFLRIWLGLNVSTRRAAIVIAAPVCGLRPTRAFLSRRTKLPKPESLTLGCLLLREATDHLEDGTPFQPS